LQRKSMPDIDRLAASLPPEVAAKLLALAELHGSVSVVAEAKGIFANEPVVLEALGELESTLALVQSEFPDVGVYVDLTELRGFRYHTGLVFAVYLEGRGSAVAKGGRYDNIGAVFGRDRPATGFAIDLKALIDDAAPMEPALPPVIAPVSDDPLLRGAVAALRASGRTVIVDLESGAMALDGQRLVLEDGEWIIEGESGS